MRSGCLTPIRQVCYSGNRQAVLLSDCGDLGWFDAADGHELTASERASFRQCNVPDPCSFPNNPVNTPWTRVSGNNVYRQDLGLGFTITATRVNGTGRPGGGNGHMRLAGACSSPAPPGYMGVLGGLSPPATRTNPFRVRFEFNAVPPVPMQMRLHDYDRGEGMRFNGVQAPDSITSPNGGSATRANDGFYIQDGSTADGVRVHFEYNTPLPLSFTVDSFAACVGFSFAFPEDCP